MIGLWKLSLNEGRFQISRWVICIFFRLIGFFHGNILFFAFKSLQSFLFISPYEYDTILFLVLVVLFHLYIIFFYTRIGTYNKNRILYFNPTKIKIIGKNINMNKFSKYKNKPQWPNVKVIIILQEPSYWNIYYYFSNCPKKET